MSRRPDRTSPLRPRRDARRPTARGGYNLVILMIMVTVMNVLVAAALPVWSQAMQREKEQELIFRGLQYAEAIRVFQVRNGRYPVRLAELLEVEPRAIRQLWTDPFRDDGKWGLILAQSPQPGQQVGGSNQNPGAEPRRGEQDAGRRDPGSDEERDPLVPVEDVSEDRRNVQLLRGEVQATGPIVGVRSLTDKDSIRTFLGSSSISDWQFVADLIPILPNAPGLDSVPRLTSRYIGRSFPQGVEPQQGSAPADLGSSRDPSRDRGGNQGSDPSGRPDRPDRPQRPSGGDDG